ncbi:MAG: hypothetical protein QOE70_6368 [Chthoniobacter sp.]|jgi:hypothetical protein|nr:hypothetical protein [Chthoniobacter sp.]
MPRKKGQRVKSGTNNAETLSEAIDSARWGDLAKNPARDVVFVVWSSRIGMPAGLTEEDAADWQTSVKEWESKLAAMTVEAVKAGDEKTLKDILAALHHCNELGKTGAVKAVDPQRVVAFSTYGANPDTTSQHVRNELHRHKVAASQKTVRRIFKGHKIILKKAPAGRPKK